jgi:UDP-N-acetylmuramate dehydrogenase
MPWKEKIKNYLPEVKTMENLNGFTSMGVGGPASLLFVAKTFDELVEAVVAARTVGVNFRVIGNGTNVVFSDKGFDGFIIVNKANSFNVDLRSGCVIADSGLSLSRLILEAASAGLSGLEPLYGIPGTVGGAIVVNAGAHGVAIADYLKSASILVSSEKILNCKKNWFDFSYRHSKLKGTHSDSPPVVLRAIFQFQRRRKENCLADIAKNKSWRESHQPIGERTSGSIFTNPTSTDNTPEEQKKMTAGYLLEASGAKKMNSGGARVSKMHANWIVANQSVMAENINDLIGKMQNAVSDKFSVNLKREIELLGNWDD